MLSKEELKSFLDFKYEQYNCKSFIDDDPVQIPHMFANFEDVEISAFLTSLVSWGSRKQIVKAGRNLMQIMDFCPYDFVMKSSSNDLSGLSKFVYRTFNSSDVVGFIHALRNVYNQHGNLESAFAGLSAHDNSIGSRISLFRQRMINTGLPLRSHRHLPDPRTGSAAKRMNMFLRWMVRKDSRGVDFGIWKSITPGELICPLDLHSGNIARALGLLIRKQNDWKAAEELTNNLRTFDAIDPVKYDFALFGTGWYEKKNQSRDK